MTKDLEEIYWLWNQLALGLSDRKPKLVVAIQKEMFRGHFFFDKMRIIELKPPKPERMVEAYMHQFKSTEPFTQEALLRRHCAWPPSHFLGRVPSSQQNVFVENLGTIRQMGK